MTRRTGPERVRAVNAKRPPPRPIDIVIVGGSSDPSVELAELWGRIMDRGRARGRG
jgi:hypothetical protein